MRKVKQVHKSIVLTQVLQRFEQKIRTQHLLTRQSFGIFSFLKSSITVSSSPNATTLTTLFNLDSHTIRVTTTTTLNSQTLEEMATLLQNHQATLKIRAPPLIKTSEIKVEHELADATQESVKELHGFILAMFPLRKKVVIKK
jgi:hypothetical protein